MHWTINRRILLGNALALGALFIVALVAYASLANALAVAERVTHSYQALEKLDELLVELLNVETSARGYVITGQAEYLEPYTTTLPTLDTTLHDLHHLMADNLDQHKRLAELDQLVAERLVIAADLVRARRAENLEAAHALMASGEGKRYMDAIRALLTDIEGEEQILLAERQAQTQVGTRKALLVILGVTLGAGVVTGLLTRSTRLYIVHHCQQLIAGARAIGMGNLAHRLPITTQDEIGQLAAEFNGMATRLEASQRALQTANSDLENRIQARTTELTKTHARYINTLDHMLEGGQIIGFDWRYLYLNDVAAQQGRKSKEELLGHTMLEMYPGLENSPFFAILRQCMADRTSSRLENEFTYPDGDKGWFELSLEPIPDGIFILSMDITKRKQAEDRLRLDSIRAEALARIAARLNAQLDLDAVVRALCEETTRALNVPAASVSLYDPATNEIHLENILGLPSDYRQRHKPLPRPIYTTYQQQFGSLIILPQAQTHTDLPNVDLYVAYDIQTIVMASLLRESELVGLLTLYTLGEARTFTADELAILQGLADQAAQAIVNARLLTQAQQRLQQLQALRAIDIAIASSLDLQLTLSIVLEETLRKLQVDAAVVLLLNPHTHWLEFSAGRGFKTEALRHTRLRVGESYAGVAAQERRIVQIANLQAEPGELARAMLLKQEGYQTYFAAPLIAKGEVKGVLEVFHRTPFLAKADWLDFFEMLAGQTAIAIDSAELFNNLQRSNTELRLAYDATIEGWSRAMDLRDHETEGHTRRVMEMTLRLAKASNAFSEAELLQIRRGALLHDIGKIGVPDAILLKPGKLTDEEWLVMRLHPQLAYDMLAPITFLRPALDIPYRHHEKWDGTGYPRGLRGEQIPLAARLFAVVDVWDALRSDRPYRAAWPEAQVREHIRALSGTHFDPQAVELFLQVSGDKLDC